LKPWPKPRPDGPLPWFSRSGGPGPGLFDGGGWGKAAELAAAYSDATEGRMVLVQLNQGGRTWTLTVLKLPKEAFKQCCFESIRRDDRPVVPTTWGVTGENPWRSLRSKTLPSATIPGPQGSGPCRGSVFPFNPGNRSFFREERLRQDHPAEPGRWPG